MQTENAPSLLCQGRGNFVRSCLKTLITVSCIQALPTGFPLSRE